MAGIDSYVKALLHLDSNVTDVTGRTWTNNGVSFDTSIYKFGTASISFPGDYTKYLSTAKSADFVVGTGDYTIDYQLYIWPPPLNLLGPHATLMSNSECFGLGIGYHQNYGAMLGKCGYSIEMWAGEAVTRGEWHHIACVRSSGTAYIFHDGVLKNSGAVTTDYSADYTLLLGRDCGDQLPFVGLVDEFRFSKGIARWTSDFTPPSYPYSYPPKTMSVSPNSIAKVMGVSQYNIVKTSNITQ